MAEKVQDAARPGSGRAALEAVSVYLRVRVLVVLLLGFSSGLPLALSGETLRVWMADVKVDLTTIGLFALVATPYTFKFLWAPLVDGLDVPWLTAYLGRRRAWLLASQLALLGAILLLAGADPISSPWFVAFAAVLIATASATQDIVVDAFRVESLGVDEQAAGMASYVAAYRIGMLVSGAGLIALTAWLEIRGVDKLAVWSIAYVCAGALVGVGMLAVLLAREPAASRREASQHPAGGSQLARVFDTAVHAFSDFLLQRLAIAVLLFVVLFKLCDALAGAMTAPFVFNLGYDKATYVAIVKGVGLIALLAGGFAGGVVAKAVPLGTALWLGAALQMASNLAFVWLYFQPVAPLALTIAIVFENFTGAIGTVIFVAYLSALCRNPLHTATQYALLTALASTARTFLASGTGFLVEAIGWPLFFLSTVASAVPALLLLLWLQHRGHFATLEAERGGEAAGRKAPATSAPAPRPQVPG